ncbi:MAG TPA: DUF2341 domain-containing protein [archaeon]|nr:DUF2341 domain-containing protein [archaeon]
MNNQKGAANLITTMAYLLISFVIIAMVTTSAIDLISKSKEKANYETMIDYFDKFNLALNDTISNKQTTEFNFYNPGEIEIDCTNNQIIGKINYSGEYRTDETVINDIVTYKKNNQIYFEKDLDNLERIQLNCKDIMFNLGKNQIALKYQAYDEDLDEISIDIYKNTDIDEVNSWYSSNWSNRLKITINKDYITEDLTNFPMLIDISDLKLLIAKDDGKDIIFIDSFGNKLDREIEKVIKPSSLALTSNSKIIDYYIEDLNVDKKIWIKTSIPANTTRKIKITKTPGYSPNGDYVFEFFDDFDDWSIDPNKWGYINGFPLPAENDQNIYLNGTTAYIVSKNKLNSYNKIFKMRMYPVTNTSSLDCAMHVMADCATCGYTYNKGIGFGTNINTTNYEIFASNYCGAAAIYASTISSANGRYLNFDATITDENTYKVRQVVYDDNGALVNDSGFLTTNTQRCFNETGYFNLRTQPAAAEMYVDYVFVRKYAYKVPWVDVYDNDNFYEIVITNGSSDNLTDYQVSIPNNIIGITTKTESLKVEELPLTAIGFIEERTIPYYIEDDGTNKFIFIKQTIPANTTRTLKITKESGYIPNGDRVFDFFDDFTSAQLDLGKWTNGTTPTYVSSGETLRINVGAVTLTNPLSINLQDNYIIRSRSKNINQTANYGGTMPGISSATFTASGNTTSEAQIETMKGVNNLNLHVFAGNGTAGSHNVTNTSFASVITLDQYYLFDIITKTNTFDLNMDNSTIYSYPSTTTFTRNINYIHLGQFSGAATDIGDTEFDYIYVRKYVPVEPTVNVIDNGDNYTITIENTTSDDLNNYQVKIPTTTIPITSKSESLKIEYTTTPTPNSTTNTTNTRVIAWVKIPNLSSTQDTNIYMYFGSDVSEDNSTDVWDENYLYVEHFDDEIIQNNQSSLKDSTGKVIATPYLFDNTPKSKFKTEGFFGDSVLCDGFNDYIIAPISLSEINDNNLLTVSLWAKTNIISKLALPFSSFTPAAARIYLGTTNSTWSRGIGDTVQAASSSPATTNWTKLVLTINKNSPTNSKFFVNNEIVYDTNGFVWTNTTDFPYICGTSSYYWDGYVDEIRVEKTIRSDAWKNAEYINQYSPNLFYTFS